MAHVIGRVFSAAALILLMSSAQASTCPANLTNRIVQDGDLNVLEVYNMTTYPKWSVFSSSDEGSGLYGINNGGTVDPSLSDAYAVNSTGLVILNATTSPQGSSPISTAGLYQVEYTPSNCKSAAKLVVIQEGPVCGCSATTHFTQSELSCSISFADASSVAPLYPTMIWTMNGEYYTTEEPQPSSNADGYIFTSTSIITVDNTNDVYQCQVTFSPPGESPYDFIATNTPTYNATCDAKCACPNDFTNRVVQDGDMNVLEVYDTTAYPKWSVFPSSDQGSGLLSSNNGGTVDPSLSGAYAVNITGLVILNATTPLHGNSPISTAGLYLVEYAPSHCMSACKLVIINQGPLCSCNISNGMRKNLFGIIIFSDYRDVASIRPIMTRIKDCQSYRQEEPTQESYDDYTFVSTSGIRIAKTDKSTYQCQVTFSTPDPSPYNFIATNAPDYNESCIAADCSG